jgi:predicted ester cyclase
MDNALDVVRTWQERLRAQDFARMADVVDLQGYTEICLGLTTWTVGHDVALGNYFKNLVQPWSDLEVEEDQVVVGPHTVVMRLHTKATHVGEFLGIAGTGRRIEWDTIAMVEVADGRVVGQWAQPDLLGIYRQISGQEIRGAADVAAPTVGAPPWARAQRG